ncbi:MAG: hypothetical protein RLP09_46110 [Sandaracinaceae bacterium]
MNQQDTEVGCGDWTVHLLDQAAGQEAGSSGWEAHLAQCRPCRSELDSFRIALGALDGPVTPSPEVEAALLRRVSEDLERPTPDLSWISSVLAGAALAVVASLLAAARGEAGGGALWTVALAAVAWTTAFSIVVHTLRHAKRGPWSALPLVVAVGAILIIPTPSESDVCAACEWVGMGLTAARAMFIATGVLVGVALTTIVDRLLAARWGRFQRTAIAAGVVLMAVGPALYMACAPFSFGSLIGLLGGLVSGVALSAVRGLWLLKPT